MRVASVSKQGLLAISTTSTSLRLAEPLWRARDQPRGTTQPSDAENRFSCDDMLISDERCDRITRSCGSRTIRPRRRTYDPPVIVANAARVNERPPG
jgi:hypothetical protein